MSRKTRCAICRREYGPPSPPTFTSVASNSERGGSVTINIDPSTSSNARQAGASFSSVVFGTAAVVVVIFLASWGLVTRQ